MTVHDQIHDKLAQPASPTLDELLACAVADKLERSPDQDSLLGVPISNIDRWLAAGHPSPHRLEEWRQIILRAQQSLEGFRELLVLLRDRSEATERLREFAPFAGVLTAAERLTIIRQCVYSH